jgi:transcriptional regulator of acetoin/glycerol metabolism
MGSAMTTLAHSPFYSSKADRVELARRRWFEEGIAASGVVSDAVFQSWADCQRLHADPAGDVVFQPVTLSRTHLSLQKNRRLRDAWMQELPALEALLGTTSCAAMLIDATGVLIGATCAGRSHEHLMPVATRLGVDLSEEAVGTTAPGVAARTGQPVCVLGAEHYFDEVKAMNCAASPVRDIHGRVAGVLDIATGTPHLR